jgi:type III secretory pathway component EscV
VPDEVLRWPSNEGLVLRARQFPARYPLPDLSLWRANKDYGFAATGDIDTDKELNKQTIKKRWEEVKERELEEASIWLPEIEIEDEEDETNEEVASSKDEEVEKNEEIKNKDIEEVQSVEIEEFNFNNILQSQDKEDDEEDEDFL